MEKCGQSPECLAKVEHARSHCVQVFQRSAKAVYRQMRISGYKHALVNNTASAAPFSLSCQVDC